MEFVLRFKIFFPHPTLLIHRLQKSFVSSCEALWKIKLFTFPSHAFVQCKYGPPLHLKLMVSHSFNSSLIFHLCSSYQSSSSFSFLSLSLLASTGSLPPFISATVDLCEGGCRSEPPHSCGNQSCHFSNYPKQSFPSPALHYFAVSPSFSFSLHHYFLHYFSVLSRAPSSHSHRPIIGDTFQLCKIQSEGGAEHQRPNKSLLNEGELSSVTSD